MHAAAELLDNLSLCANYRQKTQNPHKQTIFYRSTNLGQQRTWKRTSRECVQFLHTRLIQIPRNSGEQEPILSGANESQDNAMETAVGEPRNSGDGDATIGQLCFLSQPHRTPLWSIYTRF